MESQVKTVKRGKEVKRVSDDQVCDFIDNGWSYCAKNEWKKIRDADRSEKKEETVCI